jgi:hypothetical protein
MLEAVLRSFRAPRGMRRGIAPARNARDGGLARSVETTGRRSFVPALECLEERNLLTTASPGVFVLSPDSVQPATGGLPAGFSPAQIRQAYGFNQITFNSGTVVGNGAGQTIAIIDAYDQPYIASNLAVFDATYGIAAPPSFTKVNEDGGSSLPAAVASWGLEESLDVEWAHAIAPGANILLVEANTSSSADLLTAVNYARNQTGVSVVSMSFGAGEWSGESAYDDFFTTPAGHSGVAFVASSGDDGSAAAPEWPSVSPEVLAVGGTQLSTDAAGDYIGETGWSGSGGGISLYEPQPSYQKGVVSQSSTARTVPDVAYDASSNSPFAIYDTSSYSGWLEVYGTSCGAPQWSALVAIADQGRVLGGQGTLDGASQLLPMLYGLSAADFHDVTTGSNGGYSAGPGYDLVTGRGTPLANLVVPALVGQTYSPPKVTITTLASNMSSTVYGESVTFTAEVFASDVSVPSGTVAFMEDGTLLGEGTLSGGTAAFTTDTLAPGGNTVTATFEGASTYGSSSSYSVFQVVMASATSVELLSSDDPTVAGQPVTLTASVNPVAPGSGTPTGYVYFLAGTAVMAAIPLNDGSASLVTAAFAVGTTGVSAVYGGDGDFLGGDSGVMQQRVNSNPSSGAASGTSSGSAPATQLPMNGPGGASDATADNPAVDGLAGLAPFGGSSTFAALNRSTGSGGAGAESSKESAASVTTSPPDVATRSLEGQSVSDAVWTGWDGALQSSGGGGFSANPRDRGLDGDASGTASAFDDMTIPAALVFAIP